MAKIYSEIPMDLAGNHSIITPPEVTADVGDWKIRQDGVGEVSTFVIEKKEVGGWEAKQVIGQ